MSWRKLQKVENFMYRWGWKSASPRGLSVEFSPESRPSNHTGPCPREFDLASGFRGFHAARCWYQIWAPDRVLLILTPPQQRQ